MSSAKANAKNKKKPKKAKEKTKWCFCKSLSAENMIACENPSCAIEWYHFKCVGLDEDNVPKGDWFCRRCIESAEKKAEKDMRRDTARPKSKPAPPSPVAPPAPPHVPKKSKPIFICEFCESQFSSKDVCIEHKKECRKHARRNISPQPINIHPEMNSYSPLGSPPSSRRSYEAMGSRSPSPRAPQSRPRSPNSTQGSQQVSLANFTDEQILAALEDRKAAFVCVCGIVFEDKTLYYLHRGCHSTGNPLQCSFCKHEAANWYDFMTHFFVHKSRATCPAMSASGQ